MNRIMPWFESVAISSIVHRSTLIKGYLQSQYTQKYLWIVTETKTYFPLRQVLYTGKISLHSADMRENVSKCILIGF